MAALERAGQRLQADVVRAAVAGEHDDGAPRRPAARSAARSARCALSTPLATAAAFSNATWIQGTFQAVVGYRVVATSRQPVALTTTIGRSIVLSTVRTTSGIPQPWQSEWPPRSGGTPCWLRTSVFRRDIGSPRTPT